MPSLITPRSVEILMTHKLWDLAQDYRNAIPLTSDFLARYLQTSTETDHILSLPCDIVFFDLFLAVASFTSMTRPSTFVWCNAFFAASASVLFANETNPNPLLPRSLKMISTSLTLPNFSNIVLKSGSRKRNGMLETCNLFNSGVAFSDSEKVL